MRDAAFTQENHDRLLANIVQLGVVEQADPSNAVARVRIGGVLTGWLPMLTQRSGPDRCWWPFEAGEQVCVLAPSGNLTNGVILGAVWSGAYPANGDAAGLWRQSFADGAVIEYDRNTHHLRLQLGGGTAEIVATGGITINGTVTVAGDVIADGISLKAHTHGGVMPGAGSTGGPQ